MLDRLAALLRHYPVEARLIHAGRFCREQAYTEATGYLHVLRAGSIHVRSDVHESWTVSEPTLIFYPAQARHVFVSTDDCHTDLFCATVGLGQGELNPLVRALPRVITRPLLAVPSISATLDLLIDEATGAHCGWQAAADRLFEIVLIQLLRHLMDEGQMHTGLLAGLSDPRLAKAITAVHESPASPWGLETMASAAGMSRARFAAHFHAVVGEPPGQFLSRWRTGVACTLLRRGKPVSVVANEVGYGSATALGRAFRAHLACTPREWLGRQRV
ncbi:AraC family transcriptional regulator [Nitrogeniibacter aestuarii]|uniref:AraC family transcriptional regulator n=1 Tax=Nitrogeniibacter aestuarii TaxID=2815343 RepID=UPI001D1231A6|nr:AraC family transcriptional regulator [Nitrogeniibacter aestuarii]